MFAFSSSRQTDQAFLPFKRLADINAAKYLLQAMGIRGNERSFGFVRQGELVQLHRRASQCEAFKEHSIDNATARRPMHNVRRHVHDHLAIAIMHCWKCSINEHEALTMPKLQTLQPPRNNMRFTPYSTHDETRATVRNQINTQKRTGPIIKSLVFFWREVQAVKCNAEPVASTKVLPLVG